MVTDLKKWPYYFSLQSVY